ncbi:DNA-binding transcriptional regulator, LysR family [Dyella jiangningensis]|uniref:LysR family transcriptional regulator n=1 Tax=Dyella sp. AtDHG13 TaxID=1938897 RepID=UPI00088BF7F8|nr:LysR family transcriptional regulator [Dyella sp. AtDHG13]PXV61785.1 LysR family transcriptional regulator [Dyella sp. AtDHG13]SDJ63931.1 DNA-binding transcriptional regulator, LysR family [Dyella jiangningensis]
MADVNLNRLSVFVALVRAGSFTAAAEVLGMTKAMVSQHIARLESELGVSLLSRSTRRMTLTEAGTTFHAACVRILADAEDAIEQVGRGQEKPSGTLRLTATTDYGPAAVAPALAEFLRTHPDMQADLVLTDHMSDLIAERFDMAIRMGWLRDSNLRSARLSSFRQLMVASPTYLARRGEPRQITDLASHDWIALALLATPLRWTFTAPDGSRRTVRMRPVAQANNVTATHALVRHGAGVSVLPDYLVTDDIREGRLVVLMAQYSLPDCGIYAVYPGRQPPAKVRAFIDHMRATLAAAR